jgi:hypothetical protein
MPRPLLGEEEEGQLSPLWQNILPGLSFQTGACRQYRIRLALFRIRILNYLYGSGSFHQQAKMDFYSFWLQLLPVPVLKTGENVPTISKKLKKIWVVNLLFVGNGILKVADRKWQDPDP